MGFLVTGILFQRITDIVAFFLSAVLLSIYVVAHYITRTNSPVNDDEGQKHLRLVCRQFSRRSSMK